MRTLTAAAATAAALASTPALAETISKPSPHSVSETADRLVAAVEEAGAAVIARVDHAGAARGADLELADSQLVIFGNPRVGTPAMQQDMRAGLTLPLRVLVYDTGEGTAVLYHSAGTLFAGMDVDQESEAATRINGALTMLTDKAVAE